jgi:hypothetical protein
MPDRLPAVMLDATDGTETFGGSGTAYTLNLGTFEQGATVSLVDIDLANNADAPSDSLGGTFTTTGASAIAVSGLSDQLNLPAGGSVPLTVMLATTDTGIFQTTITFAPQDQNSSGYSAALPDITLNITGTIIPAVPTTAEMFLRDSTGAFYIYDIGNNSILAAYPLGQIGVDWQVAGFGDFSSNPGETDMLMRATSAPNTADFKLFDISDNSISSTAPMGAVGLEWQVAGFGDFSGNPGESDMLMRATRGPHADDLEFYDISNNTITSDGPLGAVGLEWTFAGFGDFSGNANETDMLMRNSAGAFEVYDISNNAITSAAPMGAVGPEWTVAGFGDFSGNANETDMLMQATSGPYAGDFEVYDISHNAITSATAMGAVGPEWTVAGFGDFSGNANETDMLMQATRGPYAGDFEVYDISHNAITSAAPMGAVGLEWTVAGFSPAPPAGSVGGSITQLVQAMASLDASAAVNGAPSASLGGADTLQQTPLAIPH